MESAEVRTFPRDILALIFEKVPTIDLTSVSQVCSTWRAVASDSSQLRSWTYDDDITDVVGTKASVTPMKAKTALPKHWVNPTEFSPLASFTTPTSLNSLHAPKPLTPLVQRTPGIFVSADAGCSSPRTPSPVQCLDGGVPFSQIVRESMEDAGRFYGDVDVCSSRLNDRNVQMIFRNCPNLRTLRLQHVCGGKRYMRGRSAFTHPDLDIFELNSSFIATCGCGQLTERAFENVARLCPKLTSVTLVLQHVLYRKALRSILAELGALPHLHTLAIELRMPSFGMSVKSEFMWTDHARCSDSVVYALINAGPPPLQALGLNRCDLSDSCIAALAAACPKLEAIDLHAPVLENLGWYGMSPSVGEKLKDLKHLTAAAIGYILKMDDCHFDSWSLSALKRLRLETSQPLSAHHLRLFRSACPKLESLHLLWKIDRGVVREAHICPITSDTIAEYIRLSSAMNRQP